MLSIPMQIHNALLTNCNWKYLIYRAVIDASQMQTYPVVVDSATYAAFYIFAKSASCCIAQ